MPEYDEFYNEEDDAQSDELSEQYHAEQDALNESEEFLATYGFAHDCTCADDWDEGNVGLVSVCYLRMCQDALDELQKRINIERELRAQNAQFRIKLVEAGIDPGDG
jgi:hypothetical protein